jgi:hypothetical protein
MTLDRSTATILANDLIRCGGQLLRPSTLGDERAIVSIAATLAEASQVLEKAVGRVVLAPPKGESTAAGPCPAVVDDEVA